MRRRRLERSALWTSAVGCVVVGCAWALSFLWLAEWSAKRFSAGVLVGTLILSHRTGFDTGSGCQVQRVTPSLRDTGPHWLPARFDLSTTLNLGPGREESSLFVPLWMFEVPFISVLAFLFWRRRRPMCDRLSRITLAIALGLGCSAILIFVVAVLWPLVVGDALIPRAVNLVTGVIIPFLISLRMYMRLKHLDSVQLGLCVKCGYNLTGNTSGVCPECGSHLSSVPDAPAS